MAKKKPTKPAAQPQRHPKHKRAEIVAAVQEMIGRGLSLGRIKQEVSKRYGTKPRAAERFYTEANREIIAATGVARDEAAARVLGVLDSLLEHGTPLVKLKAVDRIIKLYGLHSALAAPLGGESAEHDTPADVDALRLELSGMVRAARERLGIEAGDSAAPPANPPAADVPPSTDAPPSGGVGIE